MAWFSLFIMMALSQNFIRGETLIQSAPDKQYYKVPIPWGIKVFDGIVDDVCRTANMKPLCYKKDADEDKNADDCIHTGGKKSNEMDNMAGYFSCTEANGCTKLSGIFVERKDHKLGAVGVVDGVYPKAGSEYTSKLIKEGTDGGQAYALCVKE